MATKEQIEAFEEKVDALKKRIENPETATPPPEAEPTGLFGGITSFISNTAKAVGIIQKTPEEEFQALIEERNALQDSGISNDALLRKMGNAIQTLVTIDKELHPELTQSQTAQKDTIVIDGREYDFKEISKDDEIEKTAFEKQQEEHHARKKVEAEKKVAEEKAAIEKRIAEKEAQEKVEAFSKEVLEFEKLLKENKPGVADELLNLFGESDVHKNLAALQEKHVEMMSNIAEIDIDGTKDFSKKLQAAGSKLNACVEAIQGMAEIHHTDEKSLAAEGQEASHAQKQAVLESKTRALEEKVKALESELKSAQKAQHDPSNLHDITQSTAKITEEKIKELRSEFKEVRTNLTYEQKKLFDKNVGAPLKRMELDHNVNVDEHERIADQKIQKELHKNLEGVALDFAKDKEWEKQIREEMERDGPTESVLSSIDSLAKDVTIHKNMYQVVSKYEKNQGVRELEERRPEFDKLIADRLEMVETLKHDFQKEKEATRIHTHDMTVEMEPPKPPQDTTLQKEEPQEQKIRQEAYNIHTQYEALQEKQEALRNYLQTNQGELDYGMIVNQRLELEHERQIIGEQTEALMEQYHNPDKKLPDDIQKQFDDHERVLDQLSESIANEECTFLLERLEEIKYEAETLHAHLQEQQTFDMETVNDHLDGMNLEAIAITRELSGIFNQYENIQETYQTWVESTQRAFIEETDKVREIRDQDPAVATAITDIQSSTTPTQEEKPIRRERGKAAERPDKDRIAAIQKEAKPSPNHLDKELQQITNVLNNTIEAHMPQEKDQEKFNRMDNVTHETAKKEPETRKRSGGAHTPPPMSKETREQVEKIRKNNKDITGGEHSQVTTSPHAGANTQRSQKNNERGS